MHSISMFYNRMHAFQTGTKDSWIFSSKIAAFNHQYRVFPSMLPGGFFFFFLPHYGAETAFLRRIPSQKITSFSILRRNGAFFYVAKCPHKTLGETRTTAWADRALLTTVACERISLSLSLLQYVMY